MTHSFGLLLLPLEQESFILAELLLLPDGLLLFFFLGLYLLRSKVVDAQAEKP